MKHTFDHFALVTGASSGIGREMAGILAKRGWNLVLVSRGESALRELKNKLESECKVRAEVIPADLSKRNAAELLHGECRQLGIETDILINNAGVGYYGDVTTMEPKRIESLIALDITALTALSALFGKDMRERGRGRILNVGSVAGYAPLPHFAAYSAAKTYVYHFSRALREEMKPFGVSVTLLAPGRTRTGFFEAAGARWMERIFPASAKAVAEAGIRGMFEGKAVVIPGLQVRLEAAGARIAPVPLLGKIMKWRH